MPVELTLRRERRGELDVRRVSNFEHLGVEVIVTDRSGGVSRGPFASLNLALHVGDLEHDVMENRRRVACAMNVELDNLVFVDQVHGTNVLDVAYPPGPTVEADAIYCATSNVALAIMVADCVPIVLADTKAVAVVHAGWRGLQAGVLGHALQRFADAKHTHAFLGPCISSSRYQVGPEVARHFRDVPAALLDDEGDRSLLDLRAVAIHQLSTSGVTLEHISVSHDVTDGGGTFFSDRHERPCGRFAVVAKRSS